MIDGNLLPSGMAAQALGQEPQAALPEAGKTATSYQFMRQGDFCLDNRDAKPGHLVFNRSVSLKDSFKKK